MKQEEEKINKRLCKLWQHVKSTKILVGGDSSRSRKGAPSQKGGVANGQPTKASNVRVRVPPLPLFDPFSFLYSFLVQ